MQKIRSRRHITSGGNVLVESALILLAFFGLLIGTFDFGQFLYVHQSLVERVRYAARWAATSGAANGATADQVRNMVLYNQSTSPGSGTPTYFNLTASNVTVTYTTDTVCFTSGAQDSLFKRVTIQVSGYQYVILSPYISGTYTGPTITVDQPIYQDFSSPTTMCS